MSLPKYGARRLSAGNDTRHETRVASLRWRVVRHDGTLLGGFTAEADAQRVAHVINREGATPGHAHVVAPKGAR